MCEGEQIILHAFSYGRLSADMFQRSNDCQTHSGSDIYFAY